MEYQMWRGQWCTLAFDHMHL